MFPRHHHKEVIEMAKKVEGYIKLQIPAGKSYSGTTGWTCSWSARCKHR